MELARSYSHNFRCGGPPIMVTMITSHDGWWLLLIQSKISAIVVYKCRHILAFVIFVQQPARSLTLLLLEIFLDQA